MGTKEPLIFQVCREAAVTTLCISVTAMFIAIFLYKQLTPIKQRPNSTANGNQMGLGRILSQHNARLRSLYLFLLLTLYQVSQSFRKRLPYGKGEGLKVYIQV